VLRLEREREGAARQKLSTLGLGSVCRSDFDINMAAPGTPATNAEAGWGDASNLVEMVLSSAALSVRDRSASVNSMH
jgi:hypothetical protein